MNYQDENPDAAGDGAGLESVDRYPTDDIGENSIIASTVQPRVALDGQHSFREDKHKLETEVPQSHAARPNPGRVVSKSRPTETGITASELQKMEFPEIKYVVPGYVAEGLTILAGAPKIGKSWLALDLAVAVATGGICLGEISVEPGDVLYLALEDNRRRLKSRLQRIMRPDRPWPTNLRFETEWPRANQGGIELIRSWGKEIKNPRLVIIDVLAMFRPARGDREGLYDSDYGSIKKLQSLASKLQIAIVVVHHTRKGAEQIDPFDKVSGTLGLSGAADTVLILDRDPHGVTIYGRGREIAEIDTAVRFDARKCRWELLGLASDVRRSDERTAILDTLREATEAMSPSEVAADTGMPRNNTKQLLRKMASAGEVIKLSGRGKYRHPDRSDLDAQSTPSNLDNQITNGRRDRQGNQITEKDEETGELVDIAANL